MDEQDVRGRAEAVCAGLVSGDVGVFIESLSQELRQNVGEVISLLPLPATEAVVDSVDRGGSGAYAVVLRLVGESEETSIQTRWKERGGRPTIIEASHLTSRAQAAAGEEMGEAESADDATRSGDLGTSADADGGTAAS